ncbi:amidase [Xylariaceae sp. FL0804]|nr:amidase [Xylariaceae sp. FL0804]
MAPATVTTANGSTWQDIAADRQRHRDATIAELSPPLPDSLTDVKKLHTTEIPKTILTEEEVRITETTVEDLASKLALGEWTSTTVIEAFLRRAGIAQKLANCVTELLPERALKRATELDEYLATHEEPVGPLHGVPISVKEHLGMQGLDLNAGYVSWVGRVAEQDALLLQCLWEAGAVFYVRTTQPQLLMHLETSSNLYGTTVNPYNTALTAGGSSGGEGALLGLRGSVLGIGTDIGGSIRSPAAANGVFGLKPTTQRLPLGGLSAAMAGSEAIVPTAGPLSTSVQGLRLFVASVLARRPWLREPGLVPMEWGQRRQPDAAAAGEKEEKKKKLRVGVLRDDGVVRPHPPVARALAELVDKLQASDAVEVVEWKPYRHELAWEIIAKLYFADGGAEAREAVDASGEPWLPLSRWVLLDNPHVVAHTVPSLWAAVREREGYRAAHAAVWNDGGAGFTGAGAGAGEGAAPVDVILCPAGPGVAPRLGTARYWGYLAQWNLLDCPAVVFPLGGERVEAAAGRDGDGDPRGGRGAYPEGYEPRGDADRYNYELWREHGAEGYEGAPISLQLVARRYEDEKLLSALETLLDAAGLPRSC